jgi:glutamate/aspartate transport system substrate-binding protein
MNRALSRCLAAALLSLSTGLAMAQAELAPTTLTGTLKKVHESGTVVVGFRESSVPFSYRSTLGEPIGYSIELCKLLVAAIGETVHKELQTKWVPVTAESRIGAVESGQVDLECGSTTSNLERQKRVSFSPTMFVSGTKLMVKKSSGFKSYQDLVGKRVAVTAGTTNEKSMRDLSEKFKLNLNLLVSRDHADSLALLAEGKADAFATDDVLLYGFIAQKQLKDQYHVVGDFLSYDPYGVMFRKDDPQFTRVVNDAFHFMAQDGEIERQYKRWFLRRLPLGTSIDLPMSPQLETIIQTMAVRSE